MNKCWPLVPDDIMHSQGLSAAYAAITDLLCEASSAVVVTLYTANFEIEAPSKLRRLASIFNRSNQG